jgi:hypothetical protein
MRNKSSRSHFRGYVNVIEQKKYPHIISQQRPALGCKPIKATGMDRYINAARRLRRLAQMERQLRRSDRQCRVHPHSEQPTGWSGPQVAAIAEDDPVAVDVE